MFLELFLFLFICFSSVYLIWLAIKDNSIIDIFWWVWFILLTFFLLFSLDSIWLWNIVLSILIFLWWARLSSHIWLRWIKKSGEDFRYKKFRETWKFFTIASFFKIYMLQMILMIIVSIPIILINSDYYSLNPFVMVWLIISILWLIIEAVSDYQLSQFIETKEKWDIFTKWLYKYSRHPNYFWESVFWLGVSIISLPISYFWIIWYLVITFLLRYVSWVPMLEKRYEWNPKFEKYKKKVPIFVPFIK